MKDDRIGYALKLLVLFSIYLITAKIGLSLHPVSGFATFVWPPTGIALAAILIFGYRFWPAITLAAFTINLATGAPLFAAAGISIGNTIEPLLAAYLLHRYTRFDNSLERVNDILSLVFIAAVFSTSISATIGVSSLLLSGVIHHTSFTPTWTAWWVGDMLGDIVIASFILAWAGRPFPKLSPARTTEAILLLLLILGIGIIVFHGYPRVGIFPFNLVYLIFPVLIWTSLRYGQRGSVTSTLVVSIIAIWDTIKRLNTMPTAAYGHTLLLLQSFMGISAVTFMIMAATVSERERTQKDQILLTQKTIRLAKQQAKLVAINQAKDEFISLASHQLKTPPTVIKQYVGMMLANYSGKLTSAQRDMLRRVYRSNEVQIKVIHNLLNVAQIDAGEVLLNLEQVDIKRMLTEIIREKAAIYSGQNQKLQFTPSRGTFIASIDKVKMGMVLDNIMDNASKYSPPDRLIDVILTKNERKVIVAIKDQGIGIAKKDFNKLFKKFSRIRRSSTIAVGGTGIGLYWAKKIVDLHGGSISVESNINQGSTFTITLPVL